MRTSAIAMVACVSVFVTAAVGSASAQVGATTAPALPASPIVGAPVGGVPPVIVPTLPAPSTLPADTTPTTTTPAAPAPSDYKLDVDDTVTVSVMRHPDVGGSFRIGPDGLLRLQRLTTPIDARGKTVAELIDVIKKQLESEGKLVLRPGQVSVVITGQRMHQVLVRGNAIAGRAIDLKNGWRVDDLVALMGGIPQPDRLTTQITNPLRPAPVPINLVDALANPTGPQNALLQEGDTVVITAPQMKRLTITGEGPRGLHDVDERLGLRAILQQMGFSTNGATGDLRHSRIIRNETPGNYDTPAKYIPVDLYALLSDETKPDIPFHDLDTLEIPVSQDYVYVLGEIGGPRKQYLPQDRKTYLVDIYANAGDVTANAKIGSVKVMHADSDGGNVTSRTYDLAKYLKDGDAKNNPEIHSRDMIFVPSNNRTDAVSSIWTGWGLFSIFKALVPGMRP